MNNEQLKQFSRELRANTEKNERELIKNTLQEMQRIAIKDEIHKIFQEEAYK